MDKGIEALINEAKQSSFVMEYISNFQPEDIDSDDVDLRFEADGIDTGCDVSIVDQCSKAATLIDALIAALEQAQRANSAQDAHINQQADRIESLESKNAGLGKALGSAHKRTAELESAPNGMMQLSNELAEMKRKCVDLTVWYGAMPESNGKTNWTAILHRKGKCLSTGITIDRSEYPDRVRYEADRMRYLIGELDEKPWITNYDANKHSGYTARKETI